MFKRLITFLLPVAILAATLGVAPNAAAVLSETRVGGYHFVDAVSRLAEPSQVTESQQATGFSWYDTASECSVAAKSVPSLDALSQAAAPADRGGLTAAGRSLTKHGAGARPGNSLFPSAKGNPATINQTAQDVVDDILSAPGSTIQNSTRGRFGPTIEVTAPDGRGIVYDANGKFIFFKE